MAPPDSLSRQRGNRLQPVTSLGLRACLWLCNRKKLVFKILFASAIIAVFLTPLRLYTANPGQKKKVKAESVVPPVHLPQSDSTDDVSARSQPATQTVTMESTGASLFSSSSGRTLTSESNEWSRIDRQRSRKLLPNMPSDQVSMVTEGGKARDSVTEERSRMHAWSAADFESKGQVKNDSRSVDSLKIHHPPASHVKYKGEGQKGKSPQQVHPETSVAIETKPEVKAVAMETDHRMVAPGENSVAKEMKPEEGRTEPVAKEPGVAPGEIRHLFFLKVHKSASTTVMNVVYRFALSRQLNIMMPRTGNCLNGRNWTTAAVPLPAGVSRFDILCNHIPFFNEDMVRERIYPDSFFLAIVRYPFQQFVSAFYYFRDVFSFRLLKRIPGSDPIATYLENPEKWEAPIEQGSETHNKMIRDFGMSRPNTLNEVYVGKYIQYLNDTFDLVLISERFDESMILMRRMLGWQLQDVIYIKENAHSHKTYNYTDEQKLSHKRFNMADYALYDHFSRLFEKRVAAEGRSFADEVKTFQKVRDSVDEFCRNETLLGLTVNGTAWNGPFRVSREDCVFMTVREREYTQLHHKFLQHHLREHRASRISMGCGASHSFHANLNLRNEDKNPARERFAPPADTLTAAHRGPLTAGTGEGMVRALDEQFSPEMARQSEASVTEVSRVAELFQKTRTIEPYGQDGNFSNEFTQHLTEIKQALSAENSTAVSEGETKDVEKHLVESATVLGKTVADDLRTSAYIDENPDSLETVVNGRFDVVKTMLEVLVEMTRRSEGAAGVLLENLVPVLLEKLRNEWKEIDATEDSQDTKECVLMLQSLLLLYNISMHEAHVPLLEKLGVHDLMTSYLNSVHPSHRLAAIATLACMKADTGEARVKDNILFLLKLLEKSLKRGKGIEGWPNIRLLEVARMLGQIERFRRPLVEKGILKILLKGLQSKETDVRKDCLEIIWLLSFKRENKPDIVNQSSLIKNVDKLRKDTSTDVQDWARRILFNLKGLLQKRQRYKKIMEDVTPTKATQPHVMLSYQHAYQKTVVKIYNLLKEREAGLKLWLDVHDMPSGSLLESMAEAVEGASVVVICLGEEYKQSRNCKLEAEYAHVLGKPLIPLLMKKGYKPDGWLGMLTRPLKYCDFSHNDRFDSGFEELNKQLHDKIQPGHRRRPNQPGTVEGETNLTETVNQFPDHQKTPESDNTGQETEQSNADSERREAERETANKPQEEVRSAPVALVTRENEEADKQTPERHQAQEQDNTVSVTESPN
ncbi:hypothetical protein BaRGS_00005837, partial [Batillaria attramentaria]